MATQRSLLNPLSKETQTDHLLRMIKDEAFQYVDFRFTDTKGIWHHMTLSADQINEKLFLHGVMFDGSSIPGWRSIEDSDMVLMPDPTRYVTDQFSRYSSLVVIGDVLDPHTYKGYNRDPRSIAKRAEDYLRTSNIATDAYFGPEPEFFIFDEVMYDVSSNYAFYHLSSSETAGTNGSPFEIDIPLANRLGHGLSHGSGYAPVAPMDVHHNLRAEMLLTLNKMGVKGEKHHHEVAPSQHELGFEFDTLTATADNLQVFKYVVHNVARANGKSATFLPKPIHGDNGSGMHVHQSLWKDKTALFKGDQYNDLSEMALYYIGGILKHARAINAFTNPTTNSYKRLVPGYEAPVYRTYSACNRSVAVRIPHTGDLNAKRIEVRFPDPSSNPYLCLSAMLMAGLDGIRNKIHPGEATNKNLYDPTQHSLGADKLLSRSLSEALMELNQDRDFLKEGGVFDDDQIDAYIELKMKEIDEVNQGPNPIEFKLYYSM